MRPILSLFLLSLPLLFAGCKKDEPTRRELLTAHPWQVTDVYVTSKLDGKPESYVNAYTACNLDDSWVFKTEGVYSREEGAKKCSGYDKPVQYGYWQLLQDDTQMNWKLDDQRENDFLDEQPYVKTIVKLTSSEMEVEMNMYNSQTNVMTIKFKAL